MHRDVAKIGEYREPDCRYPDDIERKEANSYNIALPASEIIRDTSDKALIVDSVHCATGVRGKQKETRRQVRKVVPLGATLGSTWPCLPFLTFPKFNPSHYPKTLPLARLAF